MAKNIGDLKIKGNVGGLSFYGDGLIRSEREGIDKEVFATKPSLKGMYNKSQEFKLAAKGTKVLKDAVRPLFVHARDGKLHNRISSILNSIKNTDETSAPGFMTISNGFKNSLGRDLFRKFEFTPERSISDTLGATIVYDAQQYRYTVSGFDAGNLLFPDGATHMEVGLFLLRVDFDNNTHTGLFGPGIFIDRKFKENSFTLQAQELPDGTGTLIVLAYVRFYLHLEEKKYIVRNELGIAILDSIPFCKQEKIQSVKREKKEITMDELVLANIALHISIDTAEADYFLSLLEHKTIKNKETLLNAGDSCRVINYVVKGCIRMYSIDESGKEHIQMFAPENWWCTDLFSFHAATAAMHTIDALEDTEVLQISHRNLEKLYLQVPKFERFFRLLFQNGFIMYQNRITSELALPAEQKYETFKKLYPGLQQRIAQKHIAAYLGITPVFLSMLRKKPNGIY